MVELTDGVVWLRVVCFCGSEAAGILGLNTFTPFHVPCHMIQVQGESRITSHVVASRKVFVTF